MNKEEMFRKHWPCFLWNLHDKTDRHLTGLDLDRHDPGFGQGDRGHSLTTAAAELEHSIGVLSLKIPATQIFKSWRNL